MKKLGVAITCIFILSLGHAQPYESFFNKDKIEYHLCMPARTYQIASPGITYRFYIYKDDTACFHDVCYNKCFVESYAVAWAYLREDTTYGKIYRYYPNIDTEYVWCDMSLNAGDTFVLPAINDRLYRYNEQNVKLVVDSVAYINGKKIIYFPYIKNSHSLMWFNGNFFIDKTVVKLSFIEGVGPTYGPLGYDPLGPGGLSFLSCVHVNDTLLYIANANAGCNLYYVHINEANFSRYINIYPNPAKDYIYIDFPEEKIKSIKLYNLLGVLLKEQKSNKTSVDISSLPQGIYLLSIETDETVIAKKIVKQ